MTFCTSALCLSELAYIRRNFDAALWIDLRLAVGLPGVTFMNEILEQEISQLQNEIGCGPADPTPLKILYELAKGPQSDTRVADALNIRQSLMLGHLTVLCERR